MPRFYIQSLFERQHQKYCERLAKVRHELDDLIDFAEMLGGKEVADVFRAYVANVPWGFRYRGERLPEIPSKGLLLFDEFLRLNRRESALCRKMRNSAFWCYDSMVEPYVFWAYGWYWDNIETLRDEDSRLSLKNVRLLLDVLLNEDPRFPTPQEVAGVRTDVDVVLGWDRTFRHKRRNLIWLFQTALRLEEELVYSTI